MSKTPSCIALMALLLSFLPGFVVCDAISDAVQAFDILPLCWQGCLNADAPVTEENFGALCKSWISIDMKNVTVCMTKCPTPAASDLTTITKTWENATSLISSGCQQAFVAGEVGQKLLAESVKQLDPCYITCLNSVNGGSGSNVTLGTLDAYCEFGMDPAKAVPVLKPCVKQTCNSTLSAEFDAMVSNIPTGVQTDAPNPMVLICAELKRSLVTGSVSATATSSIASPSAETSASPTPAAVTKILSSSVGAVAGNLLTSVKSAQVAVPSTSPIGQSIHHIAILIPTASHTMLTSSLASLILAAAVFAVPQEGGAAPEAGAPAPAGEVTTNNESVTRASEDAAKEGAAKEATAGGAAPAQIDLTVLNFALTLEHLEATYYQLGLAKFGPEQFNSIGLPSFVLEQFNTIAADEAIHVTFLQNAIAATFGVNMAVPKCTYNFDGALANIQSFITFASILEKTGVQAYDGGLKLIVNNDIKTAAATIATVEGRHSSFLNLLTGAGPAPGPFDTPLGIRPIISIAAGLIKECPYKLPATPFPALSTTNGRGLTSGTPVTGDATIPLMFTGSMEMTKGAAEGMSCNWVFGVEPQVRTPIEMGAEGPSCRVPTQIEKAAFTQAIVFVVNQQRDVTLDDDKNVVAGPATIFVGNPTGGISSNSGVTRTGETGIRQGESRAVGGEVVRGESTNSRVEGGSVETNRGQTGINSEGGSRTVEQRIGGESERIGSGSGSIGSQSGSRTIGGNGEIIRVVGGSEGRSRNSQGGIFNGGSIFESSSNQRGRGGRIINEGSVGLGGSEYDTVVVVVKDSEVAMGDGSIGGISAVYAKDSVKDAAASSAFTSNLSALLAAAIVVFGF
ncbi:hypothetical protein HDU81_001347 [Chytriomyces hyalinus]|nr:hypothetical protein HDU81_001347 [Chytriomyces hyalinus]